MKIGGDFRRDDFAQEGALGGEDPDGAGAGAIEIAEGVEFHAVGHAGSRVSGGVMKDGSVGEGAIGSDVEAHPDAAAFLGVGDIEGAFVGGEGESVGTHELVVEEMEFAGGSEAVNALEGEFFGGVLFELDEAVGRVSKVEVAVGMVNGVVGGVEAFAFKVGGEDGFRAVGFEAGDAAVAVFAEDEAGLGVEGESVGADEGAVGPGRGVEAGGIEEFDGAEMGGPAIDDVGGDIGENEGLIGHPDGAFGKEESGGDFLERRGGIEEEIEIRMEADDGHVAIVHAIFKIVTGEPPRVSPGAPKQRLRGRSSAG